MSKVIALCSVGVVASLILVAVAAGIISPLANAIWENHPWGFKEWFWTLVIARIIQTMVLSPIQLEGTK